MQLQYVKRRANKLFFSKRWPKALANVMGTVGYSAPLGSIEQTQAEVIAKVSKAIKEYDVKVKLATNSNPDDYQENEIDIMVEANLRRLRQSHGLPHFIKPDQHLIDFYDNDFAPRTAEDIEFDPKNLKPRRTLAAHEFISTKADLANSLVNIDDVQHKELTGQKLTIKNKVAGATWVALQTKANKPKLMLYDMWAKYTAFQGLATSTTNWDKFCGPIIQNRSLNLSLQGHQDLSRELNQCLNLYRNSRLGVVKIATIKRELNSIRACLKWITGEYQFDWNLQKTKLQKPKAGEVKERLPLSMEHQKMLVAYCLSEEHSGLPQATMALLYLQGGVMPTEVSRMQPEVQLANLRSTAPHVSILGETKTGDSRRRPVPVVLGLDVVRDNIEATIAWANIPRATRIGQMKRFLDAATGTKDVYVSHGLRHTFSQNCRLSNCRDDDKCTLGGWASYGGASAVSNRYGASGKFDQSNIERLYKVSLDIHRNLV